MSRVILLQDHKSNTPGVGVPVNFDDKECELVIWGNMDGATLKLQSSPAENVWQDVPDETGDDVITFTTTGIKPKLDVTPGETIRAYPTGGGASMNISCVIRSMRRVGKTS